MHVGPRIVMFSMIVHIKNYAEHNIIYVCADAIRCPKYIHKHLVMYVHKHLVMFTSYAAASSGPPSIPIHN